MYIGLYRVVSHVVMRNCRKSIKVSDLSVIEQQERAYPVHPLKGLIWYAHAHVRGHVFATSLLSAKLDSNCRSSVSTVHEGL